MQYGNENQIQQKKEASNVVFVVVFSMSLRGR